MRYAFKLILEHGDLFLNNISLYHFSDTHKYVFIYIFIYYTLFVCGVYKDAHTINYGHLQFKRTNITAVKLIDPSSPTVTSLMEDLEFVQQRLNLNMEVFHADTITVIILYIVEQN